MHKALVRRGIPLLCFLALCWLLEAAQRTFTDYTPQAALGYLAVAALFVSLPVWVLLIILSSWSAMRSTWAAAWSHRATLALSAFIAVLLHPISLWIWEAIWLARFPRN